MSALGTRDNENRYLQWRSRKTDADVNWRYWITLVVAAAFPISFAGMETNLIPVQRRTTIRLGWHRLQAMELTGVSDVFGGIPELSGRSMQRSPRCRAIRSNQRWRPTLRKTARLLPLRSLAMIGGGRAYWDDGVFRRLMLSSKPIIGCVRRGGGRG
ncbi:hypothetical protein PIB30_071794 [Stylosanthes scabra]|uniref:Uncharacterized protein n=1 Tax=Stylosanthes scabra TaxID=79078 RepID=A0ABU6WM59_9FABA|nr:hypothetical protein [Stylosanthes scabra]